MQDDDLTFPGPVTFAYYALYNLFKKYAGHEEVDDWLIVNQALSSEPDASRWSELLESAIHKANDPVRAQSTAMSVFDSEELGQRDVGAVMGDLGEEMKTWSWGDFARNGCLFGCLLSGLLAAFAWSGVKYDLLWPLIDGLFK